MSIKQQLADNIVGHWRFRDGDFLDKSGNGNDGTPTNSPVWVNSDKGYAVKLAKADNSYVDLGDVIDMGLGDLTIMTLFYPQNVDSFNSLVAKSDTGSSNGRYYVYLDSGVVKAAWDPGAGSILAGTTTLQSNMYHTATSIWDRDADWKVYADGNLENSVDISGDSAVDMQSALFLLIGGYGGSTTLSFGGFIAETIMFDTALTDEQVAKLHEELMAEAYNMEVGKRFKLAGRCSPPDETALLDLTMKPEHDQLRDVSGNFNNFDIQQNRRSEGVTPMGYAFGNAVGGEGADQAAGFTSTATSLTFEMIVQTEQANGTNQHLYDQFSPRLILGWGGSSARLSIFVADEAAWQVYNGSLVNPVRDHFWHLVFVCDGDSGETDLYVNGQQWNTSTVNYSQTDIDDVKAIMNFYSGNGNSDFAGQYASHFRIYEEAKDSDWVTARYLEYAQQPVYVNDFKDVPVTIPASIDSGSLSDFEIDSGAWKISDDGTDRWLECVTAGVANAPLKHPYGSFMFDFVKSSTVTAGRIQFAFTERGNFLATGQDGYSFSTFSDGRVGLNRTNNGAGLTLNQTATGYISTDTKYSVLVTRGPDNEFISYIKGGTEFDDWTLIDVSGGSGTNPVTSTAGGTDVTNWIGFDAVAGDKVSNFKFYQGNLTPDQLP